MTVHGCGAGVTAHQKWGIGYGVFPGLHKPKAVGDDWEYVSGFLAFYRPRPRANGGVGPSNGAEAPGRGWNEGSLRVSLIFHPQSAALTAEPHWLWREEVS